jgi:alanine racemase
VKSPTQVTIDTAALRHNLARVREFAPRSRLMAVIKANAYGHGIETAAAALADADAFAVARLEEALALRAAGFAHRVLMLEGAIDAAQLDAAARARIDLVVHNFEQIAMLEARRPADSIRAWIKLDTGMNRLGFRAGEFAGAYQRLCAAPGVAPEPTLVTHLASADEAGNPMTQAQLAAFEEATRGLPGARSVANSAAILAWPAAHADWVRPGLMLYGISPFADGSGSDHGLRPVMSFRSGVIAVKTVQPGETVGYGGDWRAGRETRMAIVAAGYGDGYPRSVPSGTQVAIEGRRAGVIGRVSMDMFAVDATDLPRVAVGDSVELWGESLAVEEVARRAGTIPYVLTCAVSQRVPRVVR